MRAETLTERTTRLRAEAAANGEAMFLGIPESWYEAGKWRCEEGHISTTILTGDAGDRCLACGTAVMLTHPDDSEAP